MTFMNTPSHVLGVLAALYYLLFIMSAYLLITNAATTNKPWKIVFLSAQTILIQLFIIKLSVISIYLRYEITDSPFLRLKDTSPLVEVFLWIFAFGWNIYFMISTHRYRTTTINSMSIKEAIDTLNIGLLFYSKNGAILLSNYKIEHIAYRLTGTGILNGNLLYQQIEAHLRNNTLTVDGIIYNVKKEEITYLDSPVIRLTITDITLEEEINEKLKNEYTMLESYNAKLKEFSQANIEATRNEEILNAKIQLHGKLGELLLITRYNSDSDTESRQKLLDSWRNTYSLLIQKDEPLEPNTYLDDILKACEATGITMHIDGKIYDHPVIYTALHECITNTMKYANSQDILVKTRYANGFITTTLSNNGTTPEKLVLKGGLLNLSRMVQDKGGSFSIMAENGVSIIITLKEQANV